MSGGFSRRGFLVGAGAAGVAVATPAVAGPDAGPPASGTPAPAPTPPAAAPSAPAAGPDAVAVRTTVDGAPRTLAVHPDESAVEAIRTRLGLCGPKVGCGHGACGACAVLVDGAPVAACLLPATALEGRRVTTVHGLGGPSGGLHPVQRAFIAHDALQCGFCTPGFVTEAAAFHDRWRATEGTRRPSPTEVAEALEGHLCRCGAYAGIHAAVADACTGRFDAPDSEGLAPRIDARDKVTGAARYTVDISLDGQLEGQVFRAPHANAVLDALDLAPARAVPGVVAVVPLLEPGGRVRFPGQEVAAVAATDAAAAAAGVAAIVARWSVLPAVADLAAARLPEAPLVFPATRAGRAEAPSAAEGPVFRADWSGNVRGPVASHFFCRPNAADERVAAARAEGRLVEGTFTTAVQVHTALEPHAAVARWEPDGGLTVYASTQSVAVLADDIAERWGLAARDVRVRAEHIGGGFGSKVGLQMEVVAAVELARAARRPVRVVLPRADEMAVGGHRPGQVFEGALAADPETGGPGAVVLRAWGDAGVGVGGGAAMLARLVYPTRFKRLEDHDVLTHGPPGKPFRAPGGPPAAFALESLVDALAAQRGEDPLALRRRWDPNPNRQRLYTAAERLPLWAARGPAAADRGRFRRGVGLAIGVWIPFVSPSTEVQVDGSTDGFVVSIATQDIGTGTRTLLAEGVARVLGVPRDSITVRVGDSRQPRGPMSAGSRTAVSVGPAAEDAARAWIDALLDRAERDLGIRDAEPVPGGLSTGGRVVPWAELLGRLPRVTVVGRRGRDPGGYFLPLEVEEIKILDELPGSVLVASVEVDTRLGRTTVREIWAGVAAGRIWSPRLATSQVEGAVVQGISYALYEERRRCPRTGALLSRGLEDYRIAGPGDHPPITTHFDTGGFAGVRGGGVGIGELATVPVAAALANAVAHATGWRPTALPLRPDRIVEALA